MSDLQKYITKRKKIDKGFAENYDEGYIDFKIGVNLSAIRKSKGFSQKDVAKRLNLNLRTISEIENHTENIKLSTLQSFASIMNKELVISLK